MIDHPDNTVRLIRKLSDTLPLDAMLSSQLANELRDRVVGIEGRPRCRITEIHYAGDEGGIMCRLALPGIEEKDVFVVSITHLVFDSRLPFARDIAAYQHHRIKRIRREASPPPNQIGRPRTRSLTTIR